MRTCVSQASNIHKCNISHVYLHIYIHLQVYSYYTTQDCTMKCNTEHVQNIQIFKSEFSKIDNNRIKYKKVALKEEIKKEKKDDI